jgi:hypothetical protein
MAAEPLTEGQVQHALRLFMGRVLCITHPQNLVS